MRRSSVAAASLCRWVTSIYRYVTIQRDNRSHLGCLYDAEKNVSDVSMVVLLALYNIIMPNIDHAAISWLVYGNSSSEDCLFLSQLTWHLFVLLSQAIRKPTGFVTATDFMTSWCLSSSMRSAHTSLVMSSTTGVFCYDYC